MDDLEKRIQEVVSRKMNDGTIEKINLKNIQKNCEGYIVAKSKRQQQIQKMKRMGFTDNQMAVILESANKKCE